MRRVRETTAAVEKQQVLHILSVCGLSYPAWKAHAPYYNVPVACPDLPYFFHIVSQTAQFSGKSY